jgi:hypothetical protein
MMSQIVAGELKLGGLSGVVVVLGLPLCGIERSRYE